VIRSLARLFLIMDRVNHELQGTGYAQNIRRDFKHHPQQYIPHIGLMYAAGLTEAESVFCSVSSILGTLLSTKPLM
jgi:hypothetical protein